MLEIELMSGRVPPFLATRPLDIQEQPVQQKHTGSGGSSEPSEGEAAAAAEARSASLTRLRRSVAVLAIAPARLCLWRGIVLIARSRSCRTAAANERPAMDWGGS